MILCIKYIMTYKQKYLFFFFLFNLIICIIHGYGWEDTVEESKLSWEVKEVSSMSIFKYTVFLNKNVDTDHILFFFHGAGGDHLTWIGAGKKIRASWQKKGIKPPIVVGISLGPKWFLIQETSKNSTDLLTVFKKEVLKVLEKQYGTFSQRSAIGISMGGFNLIQLILDQPELFSKVLLISPAIADLPPYASKEQIIKYVKRNNAFNWKQKLKSLFSGKVYTNNIDIILANWKNLVSDNEEWKEIDPFIRLQELSQLPGEYIIVCGTRDIYGFYEGSMKLYKLIKEKTISSVFIPIVNGSHIINIPDKILTFTDKY